MELLLDSAVTEQFELRNYKNAQDLYCPPCDSRKELYRLTYMRQCDGDECPRIDGKLKQNEQITIGCPNLKSCG